MKAFIASGLLLEAGGEAFGGLPSFSSIAVVPNPRAVDRYRCVGYLVPGHTENIHNPHYITLLMI